MIDAHVYLRQGLYTEEWLMKFIEKALERGITSLYLLEHSLRLCSIIEEY